MAKAEIQYLLVWQYENLNFIEDFCGGVLCRQGRISHLSLSLRPTMPIWHSRQLPTSQGKERLKGHIISVSYWTLCMV